jgi:hypothetical protein
MFRIFVVAAWNSTNRVRTSQVMIRAASIGA